MSQEKFLNNEKLYSIFPENISEKYAVLIRLKTYFLVSNSFSLNELIFNYKLKGMTETDANLINTVYHLPRYTGQEKRFLVRQIKRVLWLLPT